MFPQPELSSRERKAKIVIEWEEATKRTVYLRYIIASTYLWAFSQRNPCHPRGQTQIPGLTHVPPLAQGGKHSAVWETF